MATEIDPTEKSTPQKRIDRLNRMGPPFAPTPGKTLEDRSTLGGAEKLKKPLYCSLISAYY